MQIRRYLSPEQFIADNASILYRKEAENSLIIGWLDKLKDTWPTAKAEALLYAFAEVDVHQAGPAHYHAHPHENSFFAIRTDARHGWLISATENFDPEKMIGVAGCLRAMHPEVPMVTGESTLTKHFVEVCAPGSELFFDHLMYACTELVPPARPATGQARLATEADAEGLKDWVKGFMLESLHEEHPDEACLEMAKARIASGTLYLWEDHNQPVSMVQLVRPTQKTTTIAFVYTPSEFRNKGYASSVVAHASAIALSQRPIAVLFTDKAVATSNHIYTELGYKVIAEFAKYGLPVSLA
jgi:predicted GNAT family acetyltransferase